MTEKRIILVGFSITNEEEGLLSKISNAINKKLPEYKIQIYDTAVYADLINDICIVFGGLARDNGNFGEKSFLYEMPAIKRILLSEETRKESNQTLKEILEKISSKETIKIEEKIEQTSFIETKENITIGKQECDILISEREADYLKKILDILGGAKIIITKGDIRIEVER